MWNKSKKLILKAFKKEKVYIVKHIFVRYITHNSYAISVVPPFNRLWAQISAVISCLKSQKDMCLDYLADDLSSWWESKLKDYEFELLSVCTLYIYELIMSQLWVRKSVRYITHNCYAISVVSSFNNNYNKILFVMQFLAEESWDAWFCYINENKLLNNKL